MQSHASSKSSVGYTEECRIVSTGITTCTFPQTCFFKSFSHVGRLCGDTFRTSLVKKYCVTQFFDCLAVLCWVANIESRISFFHFRSWHHRRVCTESSIWL